jgi:SAM-dependent methyltransferase
VTAPLTLTGERTLPGIAEENYWFRRHEAAYLALLPFVRGADVLDAGCGEGYGAAILRREARTVLALDNEQPVVAHVAARYPVLAAVRGDLQRLPVGDGGVEVVANLQVVEHLHDQPAFVAECARVLRPAGTLLISTPNRLTFSPGRDTPLNPFHTRELSAAELSELLAPHFLVSRGLGLSHGPRLRRWERRNGSLVESLVSTPPGEWTAGLRRLVRSVRAADFLLSERDIDASLDLVYVAVRRPT